MHKVSVVLPCFNAESTIQSTLESIFKQVEVDYELIIVDDCSTDCTLSLVRGLCIDKHWVKVETLGANCGPGHARNIGISLCVSDLIAFIDADDIWSPGKLSVQVAVHNSTKCLFSCTAFRHGRAEVFQDRTDYISLLKNNVINTSTVMFDRTRLNLFFDHSHLCEDYLTWLDVAKKTNIQFINVVLAERRIKDGVSANKLAMARRRWQIYRKVERLSVVRALYYFVHYSISGMAKHMRV